MPRSWGRSWRNKLRQSESLAVERLEHRLALSYAPAAIAPQLVSPTPLPEPSFHLVVAEEFADSQETGPRILGAIEPRGPSSSDVASTPAPVNTFAIGSPSTTSWPEMPSISLTSALPNNGAATISPAIAPFIAPLVHFETRAEDGAAAWSGGMNPKLTQTVSYITLPQGADQRIAQFELVAMNPGDRGLFLERSANLLDRFTTIDVGQLPFRPLPGPRGDRAADPSAPAGTSTARPDQFIFKVGLPGAAQNALPSTGSANVARNGYTTAAAASGGAASAGSKGGPVDPIQSVSGATSVGRQLADADEPLRGTLADAESSTATDREGARQSGAPKSDARTDSAARDTGEAKFAMATAWTVASSVWPSVGVLVGTGVGQRAHLLGSVAIDAAALDQAIESVVNEVEHLGGELVTWLDQATLPRWAQAGAAAVAIGAGGSLALRWRAKRSTEEEAEADSSTWLFRQLQSSTGEV